MTHRRFLVPAGLATLALAVAVAGCGGGSSGSSNASNSDSKPTSVGPVTISVASSGVGDILNDSQNRVLYLFKKDTGPKSTCFGACAQNWPPVRATGKPTAGSGANASLIGTIKRSDGAPQVTYNGHPLYLYVGDNHPGAINGQGLTAFGATWYVVSPQGNQVTRKATAAPRYGY
jgi:predicted lipoprotein with Yx(FWY)xxD motif